MVGLASSGKRCLEVAEIVGEADDGVVLEGGIGFIDELLFECVDIF